MKNKTKNPLYVVKGDQVEEASGLLDLVIKKLNLQPLMDLLQPFFQQLFKMLLEQVDSYPKLKAIHDFFETLVARLALFKSHSIF